MSTDPRDALAILRAYQIANNGKRSIVSLWLSELEIIISALEARDAQIKAMATALMKIKTPASTGFLHSDEWMARVAEAALTPDLAALVERAKLEADVVTAAEALHACEDFEKKPEPEKLRRGAHEMGWDIW